MASNFIPMLSSSPPPLDDCPDDEDEEFGTFTSANCAFDSSFDSPVAGEKYKNFIKTGENGINDLNPPFALPTQNYTLNLQNQSNHIKNKKSDNEDHCDRKLSDSSTKELNAKNKDCSETSHNCVPEDDSDSRCDAYKDNDRSKRKQSTGKSNERNDLNSVHSNVNCSDVDDSLFVPPSDDIEVTNSSKVDFIPCESVGDCIQSADFGISNCDDSLDFDEHNSIIGSDIVQKSINNGENDFESTNVDFQTDFLKEKEDSFEEDFQGVESLTDVPSIQGGLFSNECANEQSFVAFQGPLSNESVKECEESNKTVDEESFEAFQGVVHLSNESVKECEESIKTVDESFEAFQDGSSLPDIKSGLFFHESVNDDEPFEANFDDFQSFDNKQICDSTQFQSNNSPPVFNAFKEEPSNEDDEEFADFKASSDEKYHHDADDEFADFKASSDDKCHFEDDEEFADFKASTDETCHIDANEFDDFQSFDKPIENISSKPQESNQFPIKPLNSDTLSNSNGQTADQDDFDDFDDFQACPEVAAPVEQGFSAFKEEPSADKEDSESPEFADFEQASFSSASGETYPNSPCLSSSSRSQDKTADKLSTVMNAIFPLQVEPDEEVSNDLESEIVDQSIKGRRLWEKLHEAEQTPGLRFQWGVSHSFQQLLRSVNVDYHSILRTSSVPIFASGLSLLEPVKGQTSSASTELEDKAIPSPRDSIPPVEFDWNSSGLVNPLDTGQSASILMDLSFLSSSSTTSSSTAVEDHSFENELLKPSPTDAFPENSTKTFILEELLSKNLSSIPDSNTPHRPTNLSDEANAVLDQLPDLSYMRAKVLMFPIT